MLEQVRIPEARAGAVPLSASALGRHAPARDDRDGAVVQTASADRRRADHRARRHHPGADPRADPAAAAGNAHVGGFHHARHGRRRRDRRSRAGDVSRRDGRRRAPPLQIFQAPQHPYTRALLAAVPRLGSMRGTDAPARFRCPRSDRGGRRRTRTESPTPRLRALRRCCECVDCVPAFPCAPDFSAGSSARCTRSSRSASTSRPAKRSRWSANRAAANRPPAARCCGWSTSMPAASNSGAVTSPNCLRTKCGRCAARSRWCSRTRTRRSTRASRSDSRSPSRCTCTASPREARPRSASRGCCEHVGLVARCSSRAIRTNSRAASASASRSPARSRCSPNSSSPMKRCRRSTFRSVRRSST